MAGKKKEITLRTTIDLVCWVYSQYVAKWGGIYPIEWMFFFPFSYHQKPIKKQNAIGSSRWKCLCYAIK